VGAGQAKESEDASVGRCSRSKILSCTRRKEITIVFAMDNISFLRSSRPDIPKKRGTFTSRHMAWHSGWALSRQKLYLESCPFRNKPRAPMECRTP
jgi:hypothetical protein